MIKKKMYNMLAEEYFGGELLKSEWHRPRLINRWQYKSLEKIVDGMRDITEIFKEITSGNLVSNKYDSIYDDTGTVNMNKDKASLKDLEKFLAEMKKEGFIEENLNPLFNRH